MIRPRTALLLAGVLLAPATAVPASAQEPPQPTDTGTFLGTWARVEPGQRQALQVRRTDDGRWEVRLYWWTSEDFLVDTGWTGAVDYRWRGHAGRIALEVDQQASDGSRIRARWSREQDGERASHLSEQGPVEIYRAGQRGEKLAFVVDPLRLSVEVGEPIAPYELDARERTTRRVWIMRKVSRRLIGWDEIPW
ncbi:MAG: hypothetical protein D6738_15465 [Acidobacteria bacterium]|nr:MAG: hypothetical protein D6738_15465 [Acidobacteriota bacterium]